MAHARYAVAMGMNIKRYIRLALVTCATLACLTSSTRAFAEQNDAYSRGLKTLQVANKSTLAQKIAIERYQLWKRVDSQYGFPFQTHDALTALLFPADKANRLYVLLLSTWWPTPSKPAEEFLCFQQRGNKINLIYRLHLKQRDQLSQEKMPANNLISFIHYMGCAIQGKIGKATNHDLTVTSDYVSYENYVIIDTLGVSMLSDIKTGQSIVPYKDKEQYDLTKDPLTNKSISLSANLFYRRYGFPIASGELFRIIHRDEDD